MKNILIPTTLQSDTLSAVKSAIFQASTKDCTILLMMTTEAPDTYSASQYLREMRIGLTPNQEEVLETCRYIASIHPNCTLKIHNQSGLSSLIFKGIIEFYEIKLVVFPHSYRQETQKIHQYLVQLATNHKCPILNLGNIECEGNFNKALYIENNTTKTVENIQQFLNEHFPLEIVSQTSNFQDNYEDMSTYLNEAISKHSIDMLVQTRKNQKIKFNKARKEDFNDKLGLPVLSLYEEAV
ncbi:hypothetical protein [Flavobacterium algicola]|uniref:hypothetical protein n=1 Tax=Flavobacterium algicola TaxID=556529 RepID=UPI001EFC7ED0|nr:hypothetical protein [Flavobacterium algicola]MCG9791969.1 hypothetical protein [Flavobacterium algicola]